MICWMQISGFQVSVFATADQYCIISPVFLLACLSLICMTFLETPGFHRSAPPSCHWLCFQQYLCLDAPCTWFTRNFYTFCGCKLRLEAHMCVFACQCSRGKAFRCSFVQVYTSPERLGFVCLILPHFSPRFNTPISARFTSSCFDTH